MAKKICNKCFVEKNLEDFYLRKESGLYRNDCKKCNYEGRKNRRLKNLEHSLEYEKQYRIDNFEKIKEFMKSYSSTYYQKNKERLRPIRAKYQIERRKKCVLNLLKHRIRQNIGSSIKRKNFKKNSTTELILGCSFLNFKIYLESKFESWMTWENSGLYNGTYNFGWDLDHIIPVSLAKTEEELYKLNHYSNFQPLCSKINRDEKKDKY